MGGGTALAAAGGLAGCSVLGGGGPPRTNTITITEEGFDPKKARASSDQDVIFENQSGGPVTLQAEGSEALNHQIDADAAYPASVSEGSYTVTTKEHPDWELKLTVGEGGTPSP